MKKGCIIAIVVVVILVAVGGFLAFKFAGPKILAGKNAAIILAAETAATTYTSEFGEAPKGSHEEVVEILRGNNPKEIVFLSNDIDGQVSAGKLVDTWRNPLEMIREADGTIRFGSAGPDGKHGTEDDVNSDSLRSLINKIETKPAE